MVMAKVATASVARKECVRWSACPVCHAAPGMECRTLLGKPAKAAHDRRITEAALVLEAAHPKKYRMRYIDDSTEDMDTLGKDFVWRGGSLSSPLLKEIECTDCHFKFHSSNGKYQLLPLMLHRLTCQPGRVSM